MMSYDTWKTTPPDDEPLEEAEEVCLECVRLRLQLKAAQDELAAYRCLNCHKALPIRSLQLADRTGRAWCNATCLTEYDRAMSADLGW